MGEAPSAARAAENCEWRGCAVRPAGRSLCPFLWRAVGGVPLLKDLASGVCGALRHGAVTRDLPVPVHTAACQLLRLRVVFRNADVHPVVSQQAELALQEAIRIAQESNDHVCLQHCLVSHPCGRELGLGVGPSW